MKTITEVRLSFWESFPEFKEAYRKTKRQNEYETDIRVSFVDYVDLLNRNGTISDKLAHRVTL